ncbi:MAG: efflux RND transporter periplasmic adaptor subunit [Marinilabiliaceae bacterium]|nr:efflux RND transporter periplasmic adaptor subunit [Marinilabiliaceae bacterium]
MDKIITKKKHLLNKRNVLMVLGGAVLLLMIYQFTWADKGSKSVNIEELTIAAVEEGMFLDYVRVIGRVEPITTIYLDAVEEGIVEEKLVEEGAMVKKGQVLVKLNNNDLNLRILDSEARLAEQMNFLRNTRITMEQERIDVKREIMNLNYDVRKLKRCYKRDAGFYKEQLIAEEDYLQSKENYELATESLKLMHMKQDQDSLFRVTQIIQMESILEKMMRNLKLVRLKLDQLNIKAPLDGQLGMLDVKVGEAIDKGQRIGQVNVLTEYKVVAQIDEHYIEKVSIGLGAGFKRQGVHYQLKVRKVYPEVREGRFKVDLVFEGEIPAGIKSGQTYHTNLQLGEENSARMIPVGAFYQSTAGQWIFVVSNDGETAFKRTIRTGRKNPDYYEVLEGLESGEQVIISGYDAFVSHEKLVIK